jgi:DUF971 family protein
MSMMNKGACMDAAITPTDFLYRKAENRVEIEWADGHRSSYPVPYLRQQCPCARCVKEQRSAVKPLPMASAEEVRIGDMDVVGGYAIHFGFTDGHGVGIYSFDHLREVCPCDACRAAARQAQKDGPEGNVETLTPLS